MAARWLKRRYRSTDIVLLDIGMPHLTIGLDAGEQIKRKLPSVKLVFLTMNLGAKL